MSDENIEEEEENIINEYNKEIQQSEQEQENYFPKYFNLKKFNILQKKKEELNNSLLFNKSNNTNILESNHLKQNTSSNNLSNSFKEEKKNLLLPRIPSADLGKKNSNNNINIKNKKRNFSSSNKNNYKNLPPRPNIYNYKNLKYNTEFIKLRKENEYMITELERLNIELRTLINRQIPHLNLKKRNKTDEKRYDLNKENEKKANRKYLHTLITEYNRIYKNLSIGQDKNNIINLEDELNNLKKNNNENTHINKVLKEQIYKNEQNLENIKKMRKNQLINLNDSENKYFLYKKKLMYMNKENERMNKLLIDEDKKIEQLKMSYLKLEEILGYYEETEESIKRKNDEEIKNKEMELKLQKLIKKKEIIMHARLTMEKSYANKIEKQNKYIIELNNTLEELNKEIKLLSE